MLAYFLLVEHLLKLALKAILKIYLCLWKEIVHRRSCPFDLQSEHIKVCNQFLRVNA